MARRLRFLLNDDPTQRFSSVIYPSQQILLFMSNGERVGYRPQQFMLAEPLAFGLGLQSSKRKPPKNWWYFIFHTFVNRFPYLSAIKVSGFKGWLSQEKRTINLFFVAFAQRTTTARYLTRPISRTIVPFVSTLFRWWDELVKTLYFALGIVIPTVVSNLGTAHSSIVKHNAPIAFCPVKTWPKIVS